VELSVAEDGGSMAIHNSIVLHHHTVS